MATSNEKLAASLNVLRKLQKKEGVAIKTSELSRTHRERLSKHGFIKEVAKGWYIGKNPNEQVGDTTSWYTSYWEFCARYLNDKYGEDYYISEDQSLLIHSGNKSVPQQLIVRAMGGPNKTIELLHETSLYEMKSSLPHLAETLIVDGIKMVNLNTALVHCSPIMYKTNTIDIISVLSSIQDSTEISAYLLDGSHVTAAGILVGAFRSLGKDRIANEIFRAMELADFKIKETNPFDIPPSKLSGREKSPYATRIRLLWQKMRTVVLAHFPKELGLSGDKVAYLQYVEKIATTDAYHSLSIEQYVVTEELIEKVKKGDWDIKKNKENQNHLDAMAAKGYWLASEVVKKSIERILNGENPGQVVDEDHGEWYQMLFKPNATLGLIKFSDLVGYRNTQVWIGKSKHVPLSKDAVRDVMPVLFELLGEEESAAVRAVLGHFMFVYIHPYRDGNGRMGRFLMNTMLASGGYPWTVIPVQERMVYMNALEKASVEGDIAPFVKFMAYLVQQSLDGTPVAKL